MLFDLVHTHKYANVEKCMTGHYCIIKHLCLFIEQNSSLFRYLLFFLLYFFQKLFIKLADTMQMVSSFISSFTS